MTDVEEALTNLGEIATRELAKKQKPFGLEENKRVAKDSGSVAKIAREDLEKKLGESILSNENNLSYQKKHEKQLTTSEN